MTPAAVYAIEEVGRTPDLVERYAHLVKRIAHHLMGRLPDSVEADDLYQAGMVGLLEAARKFEAGQGATFETFAGIRIRGAMLDEVRRHDWAPRSVYRRAREMAEAIRRVENREGRDATDQEVADELGIEVTEYQRHLNDAKGHQLLSLDEAPTGDGDALRERLPGDGPGVEESLEEADRRQALAEAIGILPERERLVMALYYDEEMNLREIGAVLGVSESRVCQIHGQALLRLRARMGDWDPAPAD